jgi:signal transduction histidine kinase
MRKGSARERATHRASKVAPAHVRDRVVPREETSSQRPRLSDVVPTAWLDQLLVASIELPLARGERAVVESMVASLSSILASYAVGACFVPEAERATREQVVVKRLPRGEVEVPAGIDPTRVFPASRYEHVVPVPGSAFGSTLHLASDDDELDRDGSPAVHLLERAAVALGGALAHAREIAALTDARRLQRDEQAFQARMLQADKLATFGQIAASLVHELNNPLTSIVAYSDYLIRKALSLGPRVGLAGSDDVERLRRISESANRMLRFTRDLVTYARPSSGIAGPVVLHGVIDQAVAFCEHVLAASGVRVEREFGADVLTVRGVGEQLVQVFVNLLTNASQAAPPEAGCVLVVTSVDAAERRIVIVVEDNGSGIAPEHLDHVFAPFFTTKSEGHGTGLGLSIVKSIVESHDGDIRVESHLGRGTRFVIRLPTWQPQPL